MPVGSGVGPGWAFLFQKDGSVVIPASIAPEVLRVLVRDLTERVRADGGEVSPAARGLLHALHEAASQRPSESAAFEFETPVDLGVTVQEVTAKQAAELLGCSPQHARDLARKGRVAARRAGWVWLIDRASLDAFRTGGSA
ncbi:helix-turn-helix domain-containing protein [Streptomyces sp. NPDC005402]|uniref:helix-turn-helix domain-containing protein n=1 Tax=Streptomyces sp. NPDC005402 TaxID=3155338 RepID=UPI0033B26430